MQRSATRRSSLRVSVFSFLVILLSPAAAAFAADPPPVTWPVTTAASNGPGSFHDAVEQANSDGGPSIIAFDSGLAGQKILLAEGLQLFEGQTTIDGDVDGDCVPDVEISGELLGDGWHGLDVGSSDNVIRGLAITHFPGSGMQLSSAWDNVVECSFIGVDLAGQAAGNQNEGIQLNHDASRNRIGPGNVVAHNGQGLAVRDGWIEAYPDFAGLTPDASDVYPTIDFTDDCGGYFRHAGGALILDGEGRPFRDAIGARFTATLTVGVAGDYAFEFPELADNARLKIDSATVLEEECCGDYSTTVPLVAGDHDLELAFQDGGMAQVKLEVSGPGSVSLGTGGGPGVLAELFKMRVPSEQNTITQTSFYANDNGQAIAFGFCGYVQNDPGDLDDGPNTLLNHPDLTTGEDLGSSLYRVSGTATPFSMVEIYAAEPVPNGPGGGQVYQTSVTVDPNGDFTADVILPEGFFAVTATATDGDGNTSQFSGYLSLAPQQISVDNLAGGGPGSLRDALEQANRDGGPTIITFDPSLAGQTITVDGALELWEDATTLDGDLDGDCVPDIEIDGSQVGGDGILVASSENLIRGLVVRDFDADGINVTAEFGNTADGNVVECNHASGNRNGVNIGYGAQNNRVGPGNVISANRQRGVNFDDGNLGAFPEFSGLTPDATGVFTELDFTDDCQGAFRHADGTTIVDAGGGTFGDNFGARFTGTLSVAAAGDYDFFIQQPDDTHRLVIDDVTIFETWEETVATVSLTAGDHQIEVDYEEWGGWAHLKLEVSGPGASTFSHGGQPGLLSEFFRLRIPTERNTVTENSIFDNGELGIAFSCCCGVTQNDPGDADVGVNGWLNFPELTGFTELGGDDYSIAGTASAGSMVEIFGAAADDSGHGEGKEFLAAVTAGPSGDFTVAITLPPAYLAITATATDAAGNTSEFSRNFGLRPNRIQVDVNAASGPGSLSEALEAADADGTATIIIFDPGLAGSRIVLEQALAGLFTGGTTIDGDVDGDCIPDVEISGEMLGDWQHGLDVGSSDNVIRGLAITHFSGSGIQLSTARDNVVECSFIGVDLARQAAGNQNEGIQLNHDASRNRIGPGNVVAHNGQGLAVRDGWIEAYPDFAGLTPDASDVYPTIDFTDDCGGYLRYADGTLILDGEGRPFRDAIGARFSGTLTIGVAGDYSFDLQELADNARLKIDGATVLDEQCCGDYSTAVSLLPGDHALELAFQDGGMAQVKLQISGPGNASLSTGGEPGVLAQFFKMRVPSEGNTITQTSFYANGNGQAIAFGFCGYVQNDPGDVDDGPNTLLNHPEWLGGEDLGGGLYRVSGSAIPFSTVEIFAAEPVPNGPGGGQEYLTSVTADPSGEFSAEVTLEAPFYAVTATATDGNTSQFSDYLGLAPRQITVDNLVDGGPGSLREALEQADNDGAPTIITFDPGLAGGRIELFDGLPSLHEGGTVIDGDVDGDCAPDIELDGSGFSHGNSFTIHSDENRIAGFAIHSFPPPGQGGDLLIEGGDHNVIECNHIGTDLSGVQPLGNAYGVKIVEGASDNVVRDNLIAFNHIDGVGVFDGALPAYPDFEDLVPDYTGVFPILNLRDHCGAFAGAGGTPPVDVAGHTFHDNFGGRFTGTLAVDQAGVYTFRLENPDDRVRILVNGVVVLDVGCCDDAAADHELSVGGHTFEVDFEEGPGAATLDLEIVGDGAATLTTDGNRGGCPGGQAGLCGELFQLRAASDRNRISRNRIAANDGLGISLGSFCVPVTPNDPGDQDIGPNTLMNFPELTQALIGSGGTVVEGLLDVPSPELATVELFASAEADPSGYGEGERYLASVVPDATGAFQVAVSGLAVGEAVTATATDAAGNTSEFSLALRVSEPVRWATALDATAQSSTSIRLTWTDLATGETGFRVERSPEGETWTAVGSAGSDDVDYLDEGLAPATLYYYRVIAFTGGVDERASNVAWASTFPDVVAKVCHQQVTTTHRGARLPSPAWNGEDWAVVWMERDGAYDELNFQLLDAGGAPLGTPRRLTESDSITQLPTLRWNGSSFALIYGEHMRGPGGEFWSNTKFARLDADGVPMRKEVLLDAGQLGGIPNQFDEALVWDGSHWGWFALQAYDFPASDAFEVGFYRLSEDGDVVLGPIRLTSTAENELDVSAAWSGGEYGIAWIEQGDASQRVLFQRLQADGSLLGAAVEVGSTTGYLLGTSTVWDDGVWAVAWSESQNDGSEAVLLRRLDPLGVPLAAAERISDDYDLEFGPGVPVYDEYPQLLAKSGGYAIYTLTYDWSTGGWEIGRLEAGAAGGRVGQRQLLSDRDGLHSLWNRVATDGSRDLIAYNEHRQGTQEIAAVVVGPAGAVNSGPVDLTSGHDPGVSTAWTVGSLDPRVVPVGGGFAALWRDLLGGSQIHARIWDGTGALVATRMPLNVSSAFGGNVAGGPVVAGVGDTFAVAWLDGDSGQMVFDRYDTAGHSILGEVQLEVGGVPEAIAFSGEVYGVAWRQGGGIALQAVTPDGSVAGPPATIQEAGNRLIRMQWTGAGWAIVARAGSDLTYTLLDAEGAFLVPPVLLTGTPAVPRALDIEWTGAHLGVTWSEDRDFDGRRQIFVTVLDLAGDKAFEDVELWTNGRTPTLTWQGGSFHVAFRSLDVDQGTNWLVEVLPDGIVPSGGRALSAHHGLGHAAGNGVTAGFLYGHRAEMYFETTACLDDATPPPAPELSALYDGLKVSLDWTPVSDPDSTVIGYNLYRDSAMIAESFATTVSYADHGVVAGAVYLYELRALNGAFVESAGVDGIVTVAIATTVEEVGEAMEAAAVTAFEQAIEDVLADPGVPDGAADEVQDALDDVVGNNGGSAANGAVDKLAQGLIIPALVKMRQAVLELQDATAEGYDTGDLQLQVTSFARLAVLAVIQINAEVHGEDHASVVAACALSDQAGALQAAGDYLGAIDLYEDAVKALP